MRKGCERRRAKRTHRRNAAWIAFVDQRTRVPCVLWDISETGARLAAPRAKALPAAFRLLLSKDGSQRPCRVVWRNDKQLGVQFIDASAEDLEVEAVRRPPAAAASSVDAAAFLLPGYGPHFLEKPPRRGVPISSFAAVMLLLLVSVTILFIVAGMHSTLDAPWAMQICDTAANFCRHPEWTGGAAALMTVVYLAVRGMEI